MKKLYKESIFIFHRDLRLEDNVGLIAALAQSAQVSPCFIFDPQQIEDKHNPYKADNCLQFMIESLIDLNEQLKHHKNHLRFFLGHPEKVLKAIFKEEKIDAVFCNEDYTPFARARDEKIKALCEKEEVVFHSSTDSVLNPVTSIVTGQKTPYKVFTAFFNKAKNNPIPQPVKNNHTNYRPAQSKLPGEIKIDEINKYYQSNDALVTHGGRANALKILKHLKQFGLYNTERNFLAKPSTRLSAHNKFGTVSIREVYEALHNHLPVSNDLHKQLYWRDFFYMISAHFPHIYGSSFRTEYNDLEWNNDAKSFELWCSGKTGFPIVDACMRELNTTGFMHNRGRMIAASFLIKDMHIDWRKGERYFATKLIDYDPAQNNGNWQWVASTGTDAAPYFRIFSPWLQSKKYDADCEYIKHWVPELLDVKPSHIHAWDKYHSKYPTIKYPRPILDHSKESKLTLKLYKKVAS